MRAMQICKGCEEYAMYNERHDAYYCEGCDVWIDKHCNDDKCLYCVERPEKPSECDIDIYQGNDDIGIYHG